jgi:hypothetical protein
VNGHLCEQWGVSDAFCVRREGESIRAGRAD